MKKRRFLWYLLAIAALVLVICGSLFVAFRDSENGGEESSGEVGELMRVYSSGRESVPYQSFLFSQVWDGEYFLAADGGAMDERIATVLDQLDTVTYAEDFAVLPADKVRVNAVTIYDGKTYERLHNRAALSVLAELPAGTYYAGFIAVKDGRYILSQGESESYGYECVFRLEIPSAGAVENMLWTENLICVRSGDNKIVPYAHLLSAKKWQDGRFLTTDGGSLVSNLKAIAGKLPVLLYAGTISVEGGDTAEISVLSVFDAETHKNTHVFQNYNTVFRDLPAGRYYAAVRVNRKGDYVETENAHETAVYDCAFILEIPSVDTVESGLSVRNPLRVRANGNEIVPFGHAVSSLFVSGGHAVAGDMQSIRNTLAEYAAEYPSLSCGADFAIEQYGSVVRAETVSVFHSETWECLYEELPVSALPELPAGHYGVYFTATVYGEYIESVKCRTYSHNEYVFVLEIPEK